jgi:sensor c-di-GMP phosphodiesterase-like protein
MESDRWKEIVDILDYAFQPIVNIHTGVCIGHEALLRNFKDAGFSSIQEVFDDAYNENETSPLRKLASYWQILRKRQNVQFTILHQCRSTAKAVYV